MQIKGTPTPSTYKHRSLWLRQALPGDPDESPLSDSSHADVSIIGGGFVGLWTALRLKELEPGLDIAILEADVCGGGASGRNGGMVLSWWPKASSLATLCGVDGAMELIGASTDAIDQIGEFCERFAPDAQFRMGGFIWSATAKAHIGAWDAVVSAADALNSSHVFEPLTPAETAIRTGSTAHIAGVFEKHAATVHPGHLVRALRRRCLEQGIRIFENSPVTAVEDGTTVTLRTDKGSMRSESVIIATNAWASGIKALRPYIFVISSDMIATEPAPDTLSQIGWTGGEGITDSQTLVCYYRTDDEGRVLFGKGGWAIGMGSWMPPAMERHSGRARLVTDDFRRYYPSFDSVRVLDDWAGPIDRTYNSLPIFGRLGKYSRIIYGVGWSGNGVGPSVVGAKILASLALDARDKWSENGLVHAGHRRFPPEPVRYIGAHLVREAIIKKERAEAQDKQPAKPLTLLASLAPSGLEDKE